MGRAFKEREHAQGKPRPFFVLQASPTISVLLLVLLLILSIILNLLDLEREARNLQDGEAKNSAKNVNVHVALMQRALVLVFDVEDFLCELSLSIVDVAILVAHEALGKEHGHDQGKSNQKGDGTDLDAAEEENELGDEAAQQGDWEDQEEEDDEEGDAEDPNFGTDGGGHDLGAGRLFFSFYDVCECNESFGIAHL